MRHRVHIGRVYNTRKHGIPRQGINTQCIVPYRINMRLARTIGHHQRVSKSQCFAWLIKIITTNIIQRI